MSDPRKVFNADESGFPLAAMTSRVLAPKWAPNVYSIATSDKTQITALACFNDMDQYMEPYILFVGQRIQQDYMREYPEAHYQCTPNAPQWMDDCRRIRPVVSSFWYIPDTNLHSTPCDTICGWSHITYYINLKSARYCHCQESRFLCSGVIGSDVPWLECPACNALAWVITVME